MFLFCFFAFRLNTIESKMEWLSFRFFTNPLWQAEALQQNDNDIGRSVEFIPCRILTPRHHVVVSMTTTTPAPLSRKNVFRPPWPVWPDWAIFESFWWHGFFKKLPKCMVNFWATVKGNTFHGKLLWLLFGQLLEEIGLLFNIASSYYAPDLNNGIPPPHRAALRVVGPILQNTFFDRSVNCRKRRNSSAPMDHRVFRFPPDGSA